MISPSATPSIAIETTDLDQQMVMTTSFVLQQIDTGMHDIIYQVSKKLVDIVKPMVRNEVQQARVFESKHTNSEECSAT